jgi:putative membrane protein
VAGFIPYCGSPPVPGLLQWNFDPVIIAALLVMTVTHLQFGARGLGKNRLICAFGWLILSLAFISPLCNLSVALFSARVTQHMIIALVAAPLIASRAAFAPTKRQHSAGAWMAAATFAAVFWIWHSPAFYDETLHSNVVYWLMHGTTVAAALALWAAIFNSSAALAFLVLFATGAQMSLLGALLTFATVPLYSVHEFTTGAWGLSWLQDQQLGGLVMWVPAGLVLTAYSAFALGAALGLGGRLGSPVEEKAA